MLSNISLIAVNCRGSLIDSRLGGIDLRWLSVRGLPLDHALAVREAYSFEPPSTGIMAPVIQRAASDATKAITSATSEGCPIRLSACISSASSRPASVFVKLDHHTNASFRQSRCGGASNAARCPGNKSNLFGSISHRILSPHFAIAFCRTAVSCPGCRFCCPSGKRTVISPMSIATTN